MTKKIKGSTIAETLIATIIILVVFFVSSLILNNIARQFFQANHYSVIDRIEQLRYLKQHHIFELPYEEEYLDYNIYISAFYEDDVLYQNYTAESKINSDRVVKHYVADE